MTVTVCVVAKNEERTLPRLLEDIRQQTYPAEEMEVLFVDSLSEDGTRKIMEKFAEENPQYRRVAVLTNEKGNLPAGWNVALRNFEGDVIVRIDAHARIPEDFVQKNVECLEGGESVSGGPRPNLPEEDTPWQRLLLSAESSMFGSSISDFRRGEERKYVKSLFHGAYRREVFEKVGFFNEKLGRTEDNEMHYRMRKAGYRLCFDPSIHSWQYTRSSLRGMMKQKYGNGYWVALTLKVCPKCLGIYYFVPFAFVLGILFTTVRAALGKPRMAILMWTAYCSAAIAMSWAAVRKEAKHLCQLLLPVIFFLLHVSYGVGSLVGFLKLPFWKGSTDRGGQNDGRKEN